MTIQQYIESVAKRYALGNHTEHTFRGDLQQLLETLQPDIQATNEPKRIECGAPDYVLTRRDVPVGYIEAKDVGVDLGGSNLKEQRDRYREALDNLIFTDYLEFRWFVDGTLGQTIRIGEVRNGKVVPLPENFDFFASMIKEFCKRRTQTIKSSKRLAEMMADKAKMLAYVIKNALDSDEQTHENSTLKEQLAAFKQILIHDIDEKQFADVYAQTIAYGMFAARFHDRDLETFSRQEAAEKIPKTNPFLRKLFQYIAGYDLDDRIKWIVDALADVFRAANVRSILKNFGRSTQTHDPIMHFYETFLAQYDPKLRKARGVYYTPEPVVDFIVRAVDDILKTEFGLPMGLADTSTIRVKVDQQGKKVEKEFHKVQILDPATGTGTFLAQVIKQIHKSFENQQGIWNQYVDEHLIPRLNGFELLMASYAMAHLKLDLLLSELSESAAASPPYLRKSSAFPSADLDDPGGSAADDGGIAASELGPDPVKQSFTANRQAEPESKRTKRFQIYLTNALEEYHPDTGTLWASWLSAEANEANHIKRDTPVMVVLGNPPYSVSSSNKSAWIESLTADYKKDLNERNIQPLSDDYIKFIRFGQHFVEKNGEGILAYISNNGFLDGNIHRQMRMHLMNCFTSIYVLNLHGNSNLKETHPDGGIDENVFDIRQGVSINIFVRSQRMLGRPVEVSYLDSYGVRDAKYSDLSKCSIGSSGWVSLNPVKPDYFLVPKNFEGESIFKAGFKIDEIFGVRSNGIKTHRDELVVAVGQNELADRLQRFYSTEFSDLTIQSSLRLKENDQWNVRSARTGSGYQETLIRRYQYRPFDYRVIYYDASLIDRPRQEFMRNFSSDNIGLVLPKQVSTTESGTAALTNGLCDHKCFSAYNTNNVFPLYLYPDSKQQTLDGEPGRVPNLNMEIVGKIAAGLGMEFVAERVGSPHVSEGSSQPTGALTDVRATDSEAETFAPIDLLDYIYAVLHSPSYREKYKEFLKIDFPRVPYPAEKETFWKLVELGGELRRIHLLESPTVDKFVTGYPVGGDSVVEKPEFRISSCDLVVEENELTTKQHENTQSRVYINRTQYFSGVPEAAWNFYIGGYQPAQKWLKDRKGRTLSFDEIRHYQKIIVALTETGRLMKEIDEIDLL